MKRKQRTPARRVQAKPSPMTAIARIEKTAASLARTVGKRFDALQAAPSTETNTLGEDAQLGALGLVEVKLTPEEEAVLARPVKVEEMLVKPTGQPYLSHPSYTRWFNEAFGRLGWQLVPRSKPLRQSDGRRSQVVCPYILYIHGQPAAFAIGEQEYFEDNKEQTYGDALEATVASALRRCAKRLGVGLELWDKRFLTEFIETRCVKVWRGDDRRPSFRLKTDTPFYDERKARDGDDARGTQEMQQQGTRRPPPAAGNDGRGAVVISDAQLRRLWVIARKTHRHEDEVHNWLKRRYELDHSKDIPRRLYDEICQWLEQTGPLPEID